MTLPVLDLSSFTECNGSQNQQFASQLLQSLYQHGFVKIVGHGIEDSELESLFAWVNRTRMKNQGCLF